MRKSTSQNSTWSTCAFPELNCVCLWGSAGEPKRFFSQDSGQCLLSIELVPVNRGVSFHFHSKTERCKTLLKQWNNRSYSVLIWTKYYTGCPFLIPCTEAAFTFSIVVVTNSLWKWQKQTIIQLKRQHLIHLFTSSSIHMYKRKKTYRKDVNVPMKKKKNDAQVGLLHIPATRGMKILHQYYG